MTKVTTIIQYNTLQEHLLLSFVKLVLVSSPFSVNAVCKRWKKSSPWMSETLVCFSDELAVSLKPLADFRIAVNVIISVLFKQPCPLQSPSMMDINCFCGKVTIIKFCCQYVQGSYSFELLKFQDFP